MKVLTNIYIVVSTSRPSEYFYINLYNDYKKFQFQWFDKILMAITLKNKYKKSQDVRLTHHYSIISKVILWKFIFYRIHTSLVVNSLILLNISLR